MSPRQVDEVIVWLTGHGPAALAAELDARLEAEGFVLAGADKRKVLGTNIWRSQKFLHLEGKGYWPKDVPVLDERAYSAAGR